MQHVLLVYIVPHVKRAGVHDIISSRTGLYL